MKLKDAASVIGSVGILLPLILIFLIATDAAYACPGTQSRVVYRTRTVNSRMPMMRTTVISYGGTASARCGDSAYVTRPVKYVAVRRAAPTYVAVRSSDSYYPTRRVRYVAVRNADYDDSPRYVVARRAQPTYIENRRRVIAVRDDDFDDASRYVAVDRYDRDGVRTTRYAAVRSGYRRDNGIVGYVDVPDSPRYVAVRRAPVYQTPTRVVAVRNYDDDDDYIAPARYVAVRNTSNACACAGELRSSLDDVETVSPRHVVVKSDYIAGTQEVIVPPSSYDDTAYVPAPSAYDNVAYVDDSDSYYTPASYAVMPRAHTVSYVPAYDDSDLDYDADLDTDNVTYVADNDIGDACVSSVAVQAPMEYHTRTVSYVPVSDVDYDASISGSDAAYIMDDSDASTISYVPVVDEDIDADTIYVAADDVGASCTCPVALRTFDDDADVDTVSYIPSQSVSYEPVQTVSYVPAETVSYVPSETVNYVPADETNVAAASVVDADDIDYVAAADTNACACPMAEDGLVALPAEAADTSTAIVDDVDNDTTAVIGDTVALAEDNGYRDGFEEGKTVALAGDEFHPADSIGFQQATIGYDDRFGDMDSYRNEYRSSFLQGYSAGFNSVVSP
jgi:hypothetical protein